MRKNSPTFFRHKGAAIAFFVLMLAALSVGVYLGIGLLTRYDYTPLIPEDAPLRVKLAEDAFVRPTPRITPAPSLTPTPLPTPKPTPAPTALALEFYSLENKRMVMPEKADAPGEAALTNLYVSQADDSKAVMLNGYAFLDGCDAEQSTIYVIVSAGPIRRFYEANVLPGSTGIPHAAARGQNLERADFRCVFSVRAYEDGVYDFSLLVVNRKTRKQVTQGLFETDAHYRITVKGNTVLEAG